MLLVNYDLYTLSSSCLVYKTTRSEYSAPWVRIGRGVRPPWVDGSAYRDSPSNYHGAKVVSVLSFGCPAYW